MAIKKVGFQLGCWDLPNILAYIHAHILNLLNKTHHPTNSCKFRSSYVSNYNYVKLNHILTKVNHLYGGTSKKKKQPSNISEVSDLGILDVDNDGN